MKFKYCLHHWQTLGWNENECQCACPFCGELDFLINKWLNCYHSKQDLTPSENLIDISIIFSTTLLEKILNLLLLILPLQNILKRLIVSWMHMKLDLFQDEIHTLRCFLDHLDSLHNGCLYNIKVNNFQNVYRANHILWSLQYTLRSILKPSNHKYLVIA